MGGELRQVDRGRGQRAWRRRWLALACMAMGCTYTPGSRDGAPCDGDGACVNGQICDPSLGVCVDPGEASASDGSGSDDTGSSDTITGGNSGATDGEETGGSGDAICGDGVVEGAEACDDGNADNFDGCTSICTAEDLCHPLDLSNCREGDVCTPFGADAFVLPDPAPVFFDCFGGLLDGEGAIGTSCTNEFQGSSSPVMNGCQVGLACVSASLLPASLGPQCDAAFCCTPYCDAVTGEIPMGGDCAAFNGACLDLFEPDNPGNTVPYSDWYAGVGICTI